MDENHIGFAGLGREARNVVAEVAWVELRIFVNLTCEETCTERAERNEANAKFLQSEQQVLFRLTPEQGILALHGSDRLHSMSFADGLPACLGESEVLPLACGDQFLDPPGHILDWHAGIDT